ncbi:putative transcription factor NAM family [Helianthus annuus]|nr:putative transcription factor NAM family [Helianthus annuus]
MGSESATVSRSKSPSSSGKLFPPGFRFHPTDEELVLYYLKRKICCRPLKPDIIGEVDVYKWDPDELPGFGFVVWFCVLVGLSKLKTGDRQWFFFSPRDIKKTNGGRSSRATMNGYWKATGKDRTIKRRTSSVGNKKTLVYYHGRAPSGLRTDWVMHEYTIDEEELKRCSIAQQYYALYKVFKKSGAGPKNGEQYGAPFIEEEWEDDDCLDVDSLLVEKLKPIPTNEFSNTNTLEEEQQEEDGLGFSNEILEFLNKVIDEPEILPPLPQFAENDGIFLIQPVSSEVEKDFLEMDDLIGPDPKICGSADFGSFSDLDCYNGLDTIGSQYIELQGGYADNLEYGPENSGLVSEVSHGQAVHDELPVSYDDLWNHHDQGESSMLTSQTVPEPVSNTSSGVIIEETQGKPEYYINQCPENIENNTNTDSWFSSALWAFVDSIPTTPASASESSALVNRAFERMSSFGRGKNVNLAATDASAASGNTTKRLEKPKPSRSSRRGILYFSVLGVLCAILWVFIGWCIELSSRLLR